MAYLPAESIRNNSTRARILLGAVEFHGARITKRGALIKEIAELFRTNNLDQLVRNSYTASLHMMQMGLFELCLPLIDASSNSQDEYTVKFLVVENAQPKLNVKMEVGTRGEMDLGAGARKPNIFGRGESVELSYTKTLKRDSGYNFTFTAVKPFLGWQKYNNVGVQIYNGSEFLRWNKTDHSVSAAVLHLNSKHLGNTIASSLRLNMIWRLFSPRNDTPFSVREFSGHTTKFSLEHVLTKDTRDRPVIPSKGSLSQITTEYAPGLLGDSAFLKHLFDHQKFITLPYGLILGGSFRFAFVRSVAERSIHLLDRLYLGGPYDVRGFEQNSIGARTDNCPMGGGASLSTALHIYAPLMPKDWMYAHLFLTTGSISSVRSRRQIQDLWTQQRISAGMGLVLNFMNMARLELNYVFPLRYFPGDTCSPGIHLGVGINFM